MTSRPPIDAFRQAVHDGDASALRDVLTKHADVRARIDEPMFSFDAPALVTISSGHLAAIDALLEFGADPNRRSDWWAGGFHPLHVHHGVAAEHLLAAGAVPDACAAAHLDRVDLLAEMLRVDPARTHERGGDGQTPLHFARSRAAIDMLLDAGADIDARDVDHRSTAAEWMIGESVDGRRTALAAYLVERGATADIFLAAALGLTDRIRRIVDADPSLLELRTSEGTYGEQPPSSFHIYQWTIASHVTPLQVAAMFGHQDTVEALAPLVAPEQRFLIACQQGDRDAALAIIEAHPDVVAAAKRVERSVVADVAWHGNAAAIALLLELGFDPAAPSRDGPGRATALHVASFVGSAESVAALLKAPAGRALVDARDATYQGTPLSWCYHGAATGAGGHGAHAEVARMLIGAGATVDPVLRGRDGPPDLMAVIAEAADARNRP